jgi:hypothetical protein
MTLTVKPEHHNKKHRLSHAGAGGVAIRKSQLIVVA